MKRQIYDLCWKEVVWRRPFELEAVQELLTHLAALTPRGPIIWEVRAVRGHVRFLIGAERQYMRKIEEVFQAHGNVQFFTEPDSARIAIATVKQLKVSRPQLSLKTDTTMAVIRATLAAMTAFRGTEECVLQLVLGPAFKPAPMPHKLSDPHASWVSVLAGNVGQASAESRSSIKEKVQSHGFSAAIRLGVSGGEIIANTRIMNILSALRTLESAGVSINATPEKAGRLSTPYVPWCFPLRLSVKELANFLLLPVGEEELPGAASIHPKLLPPPKWYRNPTSAAHDRTFATSEFNPNLRLSISPADAREHTLLIGPTGSGKTNAMMSLILSDIKAGRSVLVIDPKHDLVHDILARIPKERDGDVVVIDPTDSCPIGFNPLALKNSHNADLIADAILAVFKDIFSENWGIRTQDVLSAALITLTRINGASLLWLPPLLTDEAFRRKITAQVTDKIALQPFWEQFENMKDSERKAEIAPVMNKMRQFLLRPGLRNVLGQSNPKFLLSDLFSKRRIILVSLNKGTIGAENARLLGALLVSLTWTLALNRANDPPERRHFVSIFIDELQDYLSLPSDLGDALAQARGLGIGLNLAHQHRGQLPPNILAAVDANCRNKIAFGLNSADAKAMAAMAPELDALDFLKLERYKVYASLQSGGRNTGWMSGHTLPPHPATSLPAELKAKSMAMYGKPAEEVEAEYLALINSAAETNANLDHGAVGRRKIT